MIAMRMPKNPAEVKWIQHTKENIDVEKNGTMPITLLASKGNH